MYTTRKWRRRQGIDFVQKSVRLPLNGTNAGLFKIRFPYILALEDDTEEEALSGVSDFGIKWIRLALNGTNAGLFQIRSQYILALRAKMY